MFGGFAPRMSLKNSVLPLQVCCCFPTVTHLCHCCSMTGLMCFTLAVIKQTADLLETELLRIKQLPAEHNVS